MDDRGNYWLRDYGEADGGLAGTFASDNPDAPTQWTIFNPSGKIIAVIGIPTSLEVHQITGDEVLGVWRDADDVETVRAYRFKMQ